MGLIHLIKSFGLTIRESASDGSDFSNPDADYRVLFLGEDGKLHLRDSSGTVTDVDTSGGGGGESPVTCQGRLTLTTGVAVTTADVTAATTLYFTPFKGNRIGTYSGSAWSVNAFTEKSITLASLTAGLPYDVFIVDSTLALELVAWTNATTRATALTTQDGILVKNGATTRRYLGTICIAATGQSEDSFARRLVWNYYNRVERLMHIFDGTNTWTYGTATWRQANGSATNHVLDYVCGVLEDPVRSEVSCTSLLGSGNAGSVGIGVDSTSSNSAEIFHEANVPAADHVVCRAIYRGWPGIGYHALNWLEYTRAGTMTFEGDNGQVDQQSGMVGSVWG